MTWLLDWFYKVIKFYLSSAFEMGSPYGATSKNEVSMLQSGSRTAAFDTF